MKESLHLKIARIAYLLYNDEMQKRVLKTLEYYKIVDMLGTLCMSEPGKALAQSSEPSSEKLTISRMQDETAEAVSFMNRKAQCPVRGFSDIKEDVERARIGGALTPGALLRTADFLNISRLVKKAVEDDEAGGTHLFGYAQNLIIKKNLEDEIKRCIISEEEISDSASPELYSIRKDIRSYEQKIRSKLEAMVRSQSSHLQEPIVTIRNGRLVVPVKSEHKASVPGIVHDVSSTGATLFVEPSAAVEMGNAVRELEIKETHEIERILRMLSGQVSDVAGGILNSLEMLTQLDYIFARAKLALDMDASYPEISDENIINIKRGRHPLIPKEEIVPVDIIIGGGYNQLIITGPNTGGKTVTLKTTGLLTLMAQSGLHIPASSGSAIAVQKEVYADIGDEQSIEQSLSTFSSHMTNIVSILSGDNNGCLILLDELGAGTDPVEGAALAVAILEKLKETDTLVMATTHYSELKAYAISEEGVQNASMEFDVNLLAPTYRMEIGMPGRSNAFEISKRLGLGQDIVDMAQEHISSDAKKLEDVIYKADAHRKKAHSERVLAEKLRKDSQIYEKRAREKNDNIDRLRERILEDAKREAKKIIERAKTQTDSIISELKAAKSQNADRDIQQARDAMRSLDKKVASAGEKKDGPKTQAPKNLIPGENVIILDTETPATVIAAPNAKGEVQVQAGVIKLTTKVENLKRTAQKAKVQTSSNRRSGLKLDSAPTEIDIRGRNSEEGIMEVDLYLDRAYSAHLSTINIIHGKGTGILRANIHAHLRSHPHVKSFRLGKYGEGEDGVTVVTLK